MRLRVIVAIARKELRCFCASRRTVINTLVVSLVLVPGLLMFSSWAMTSRHAAGGPKTVGAATEQLVESLGHVDQVSAVLVTGRDSAEEMLRKGEIDAYVEQPEAGGYAISYSSSTSSSLDAASAFRQMLEESLGARKGRVSLTDVSKDGVGDLLACTLIPAGLMVVCSMSAGSLAIAATVREREAGTFEPLVSTGISRFEMVAGKMVAVLLGACASMALGLGGTLAYIAIRMPDSHIITGETLVVVAQTSVIASALFSFVFVAAGMISRTVREAQSYTGIITTLAMVPSIFLSTAKVGAAVRFWPVPLLDITAVMRDALYGVISYRALALSGLVCLLLGVAACAISIAGATVEQRRPSRSQHHR
ncbi:hypothetical protein Corgl_1481 [Coriobacterium glomerans PW2]|uniref:ABC-2 type transporter transmembrane domain-containing protein n=1 Tax=Coriobacterium glomerans (strain ATCC 49209 / DSM 20642 / JCM 10262 / PW2) TaxID=700015 RepID=F2N8Y1_CORGP|nr:ABC transporter permease [Coriobacterium glomerans]AEB07581.1 hypothetical protein Corgl_1481 [Coriobacterium glomerans PW2]